MYLNELIALKKRVPASTSEPNRRTKCLGFPALKLAVPDRSPETVGVVIVPTHSLVVSDCYAIGL